MKLQAKFNLGIVVVFALLAAGIGAVSTSWVNNNTIREAEHRVSLYIRSSWEIYHGRLAQMASAAEVLAQKKMVRDLLNDPESEALLQMVSQNLESTRSQQNLDILNLLDSDGRVLLRTRGPFNKGDVLSEDLLIQAALANGSSSSGSLILSQERLEREGQGLLERAMRSGGEPRGMVLASVAPVLEGSELIGIVQLGRLLNGATEEVDRIRDAVFENERYKGRPLGTATIFMGDLRISTNVINAQGEPAVGTRVSPEVAEKVLEQGQPWTGRAWVVDTWYLAQYDPIRDPAGRIIGMLYVGELEQKYLDMRTQAVVVLFSVILAGMGFSIFVFFMITRGVLGPIAELSLATKQLAEGDLSYRVAVQTGDEVGDLARGFNAMAAQLEKQRREIERQQQALEKLNQDLETTNRNYMEMLGFVTHELKSPLASATLSLHTVKDGYLGELNATQTKSLELTASNLDYLHDMIKNYLDLSRLEKGELTVYKASICLVPEVVEPTLAGFERGLQEKGMVVENHIPPQLTLEGDVDLLRIVYDNLLSNAIKYGRQGGQVVLDAQQRESEIVLSVSNEGAGIPADKTSMLFRKFSRLHGAEWAGKKGTGLGLYICREIIDKHGGKIWVESKDGQWITFSFCLPV